jgi:hypothetical protein
MSNIRKSFSFREGVQVDNEVFVVRGALVGIGTTVPTEKLDVRGTVKVSGLTTSEYLNVSGVSTFNEVKIGNNISITANSGVVTASAFYGNGATLSNLPTSQWIDVNEPGLGYTSIYSAGNVGVGTTNPNSTFQVGGNPNDGRNGVGITSEGHVITTGIITATAFVGIGSNLTLINADNISSGTLSNDRLPTINNSKLPSNVSVSGIVTASGGFVGNLVGNVSGNITGDIVGIASTARSLTGNPNISVGTITGTAVSLTSINVSGITTLNSAGSPGFTTTGGDLYVNNNLKLKGTINDTLTVSATNSNLASSLVVEQRFRTAGITTLNSTGSPGFTTTGGDLYVNNNLSVKGSINNILAVTASTTSATISGSLNVDSNLVSGGNLNVGSALTVGSSANISGAIIGGSTLSVGVAATGLSVISGRVGIGTSVPTSDLQLRKRSGTLLEVISDTNNARISIGQSVGVGNSSGVIQYGNTRGAFELINRGTGNFNTYLHSGGVGVNTGSFNWLYGQTNDELMTLTYDGKLGVGITTPINELHVAGVATITSNAYVGGNFSTPGTITCGTGPAKVTFGSIIDTPTLYNTNLYNITGITTLYNLNTTNRIGIGSAIPSVGLDAQGETAFFGAISVNTKNTNYPLNVNGSSIITTSLGIGTTALATGTGENGILQIHEGALKFYVGGILFNNWGTIGFNTDTPAGAIDLSKAVGQGPGERTTFIPPILTEAERNSLPGFVPQASIIYNSTSNAPEFFIDGSGWYDMIRTNITSTTSTDTTAYPVLVGSASTGGQPAFIDNAGLSYNASTNAITATGGFKSSGTDAVQISVSGNQLTFTVGAQSVTLTLT